METLRTVAELFTLIAAIIALPTSIYNFFHGRAVEKENLKQNKRILTINAFDYLQKEVLDPLILCSKKEVQAVVDEKDDIEEQYERYQLFKTQVAKCEHFAVGINSGTYDYDLFYKLGGVHMKFLYEKLKPIIDEARVTNKSNTVPYSEFEILYTKLLDTQQGK